MQNYWNARAILFFNVVHVDLVVIIVLFKKQVEN